jgi:hypothetical protein
MNDRYRERWERRQAKWDRRRAKWEARAARHEARRASHEARRAARHAKWKTGAGRDGGERSSPTDMALMGFFGGLFVLLGLASLWLFPGIGSVAGFLACLVPGIAMLIPVMIWASSRSRAPAVAVGPIEGATEQGAPQAAQGKLDAQTNKAVPQAVAAAPAALSQAAEEARPQASTSNLDPSYYRERAAGYRRRIQSLIRNRRPGPLADVMSSVVINLQQWEERVDQLTDRLTTFERDAIIQRDIRDVPASIAHLRSQIVVESDTALGEQMQRTLAGYESQQAMLDTLGRLMRRTRLQLDDTLVAMGTIYSQIQILNAMDIDDNKTSRIAQDIDEQVKHLNDLLSVLGDTYGGASQSDEPAESARRARLERGDHGAVGA